MQYLPHPQCPTTHSSTCIIFHIHSAPLHTVVHAVSSTSTLCLILCVIIHGRAVWHTWSCCLAYIVTVWYTWSCCLAYMVVLSGIYGHCLAYMVVLSGIHCRAVWHTWSCCLAYMVVLSGIHGHAVWHTQPSNALIVCKEISILMCWHFLFNFLSKT